MRALCGAIIAAASLIGLGLTALGMGTRYQSYAYAKDDEGGILWVKFSQMDTPFIFVTVVLTATLIVGLGITFLGLAYHHKRRHHELHPLHEEHKTAHSRTHK